MFSTRRILEASVALLKKLVDEWEHHSLKLLSSSSSVKHAMNSFRMKTGTTITEGVDSFLYEEAHRSFKLISRSLSRHLRKARTQMHLLDFPT
ncbi:unnamed protein product [Brassica oleracea var. botrytis]